MKNPTFTIPLTIDQIVERLSAFDNFSVKSQSDDGLKASVGSELKYRMVGSWVSQNYQAPVLIEVAANDDATSTVQLSRRPVGLFSTDKDDRFFEEAYAEIQKALEA
ncbi:hypothetical protein M5J20_04280 [Corynebacterium sp. TA-R-1]|uniref:DUF1499 domain-containing protein n=1 Tax=Corynebacterium stercoris TaxID=2943490 RepID=A0ABT1G062_9CORY|nr:hypothetical protein [Corynebacterium stercoris]MCP1387405.1 hypothetical protein [Corynebacterium stercoris]